jgi:hypothetical protein
MGVLSKESVAVIWVSFIGACTAFFFQFDRIAYLCMFFGFLSIVFDGVSAMFAIHKQTLRTNELLEEIKSGLNKK